MKHLVASQFNSSDEYTKAKKNHRKQQKQHRELRKQTRTIHQTRLHESNTQMEYSVFGINNVNMEYDYE